MTGRLLSRAPDAPLAGGAAHRPLSLGFGAVRKWRLPSGPSSKKSVHAPFAVKRGGRARPALLRLVVVSVAAVWSASRNFCSPRSGRTSGAYLPLRSGPRVEIGKPRDSLLPSCRLGLSARCCAPASASFRSTPFVFTTSRSHAGFCSLSGIAVAHLDAATAHDESGVSSGNSRISSGAM